MAERVMRENGLDNIREKVRTNYHDFRGRKREALYYGRRQNLDKVAEDIKLPDLDEVYKLSIQLKKKKKTLHLLHKLRMGLSEGGRSVTVFLSCDGALQSLVSCFTGFSAEIEREAMNIFINLGLGTPEECLKIYKRYSVYFVIRLSNGSAESQEAVAWCLGNMCLNNPELCHQMAELKVDTHLQECLGSPVSRVFQSVCYALTHYYTTVSERLRHAPLDKIVRWTIDGVERHDGVVDEAGWFLFVLSCHQLGCEYLLQLGIISCVMNSLQKLINQQSLPVSPTTALLRVLLNCVGTHPQSAPEVCSRGEQFVNVCSALLYSSYWHLHQETLLFIANVINGACQSESGKRIVEEQNLQPRLDLPLRRALSANFRSDTSSLNTNFKETL